MKIYNRKFLIRVLSISLPALLMACNSGGRPNYPANGNNVVNNTLSDGNIVSKMKPYKKEEMNFQEAKPLPYDLYVPKPNVAPMPTYPFVMPKPPEGEVWVKLEHPSVKGGVEE